MKVISVFPSSDVNDELKWNGEKKLSAIYSWSAKETIWRKWKYEDE
jgi:hypothetical protein